GGGGTVLLQTDGSHVGPGGPSFADGVMAFHWYDADMAGQFTLGVQTVTWDADGWPQLSW
ncbi:MAG TPA: arabinan endo-1,5-alpha-L-arabinosidase, partial [Microbacterium sp.]|nr:arabinan endo-1,5-alpha-L-arabinosidase [Microbacterium sp.]